MWKWKAVQSISLSACALYGIVPSQSRIAGEVIVPATVDFGVLEALSSRDLVPMLVDVRPCLYVAEAERVCPAMTERTVGVYLPWTFGNVPDWRHIEPACRLHGISLYSPKPHEWPVSTLFWEAYEALGSYATSIGLPEHLEDTEPRWSCLPLLAIDAPARERLVIRLAAHGAAPMASLITDNPRMGSLGPWGECGKLTGARAIAERGFTVPLVAGIGDRVVKALQ